MTGESVRAIADPSVRLEIKSNDGNKLILTAVPNPNDLAQNLILGTTGQIEILVSDLWPDRPNEPAPKVGDEVLAIFSYGMNAEGEYVISSKIRFLPWP